MLYVLNSRIPSRSPETTRQEDTMTNIVFAQAATADSRAPDDVTTNILTSNHGRKSGQGQNVGQNGGLSIGQVEDANVRNLSLSARQTFLTIQTELQGGPLDQRWI